MSTKKVHFGSNGIDLGRFEAIIHDGQQRVERTHLRSMAGGLGILEGMVGIDQRSRWTR